MAFALDYVVIALYLIVLIGIGVVVNAAFPEFASALFGNPVSGGVSPGAAVIIAFLEFIFYWCVIIIIAELVHMGRRWVSRHCAVYLRA